MDIISHMAGHSHWAGIKRKKEANDKKKAKLFSQLLNAITVAAKKESDPEFNPRLRTAIEKAKQNNVPLEKISTAINKGADPNNTLEGLLIEAYGPGGVAIIATATTDNRNRTVAEIKSLLKDNNGKWAEEGSVVWGFEIDPKGSWVSKFKQDISKKDILEVISLKKALEDHADIENVFMNCSV